MIIRNLSDLVGTDRDVAWGNGQSRRFLLEKDGMGYTVTDTLVEAGTESLLEYTNHLEACYCIEGEGEIQDMSGVIHLVRAGTLYALNRHDRHVLRARTTMRLVCVFVPPLVGAERHRLETHGESSRY